MNDYLLEAKTRNIIKAIFLAELERHPANAGCGGGAEILSKEFVEFNYPPFVEFIRTYNKNKNNLEEIRGLSYKCCQYNISILQITQDFVRLVDYGTYYMNIRGCSSSDSSSSDSLKCEIVKIGTDIDYLLSQTNKCKEPLYIENLLCQLLLCG
jgi:hypothetical protein